MRTRNGMRERVRGTQDKEHVHFGGQKKGQSQAFHWAITLGASTTLQNSRLDGQLGAPEVFLLGGPSVSLCRLLLHKCTMNIKLRS